MKDYCDFKVKKQQIGKGGGITTDFQLIKIYQDSVAPYIRKITKPVDKTLTIYTGENTIIPKFIDLKTGLIGLTDVLEEGIELFASFEFDVPVRFEKDSFQYSFNEDGTISLDDVRLVEVL